MIYPDALCSLDRALGNYRETSPETLSLRLLWLNTLFFFFFIWNLIFFRFTTRSNWKGMKMKFRDIDTPYFASLKTFVLCNFSFISIRVTYFITTCNFRGKQSFVYFSSRNLKATLGVQVT